MMLHGLCFREEAGARNLVFFRVKWLQPAMKGTSSVRRLRLRSCGDPGEILSAGSLHEDLADALY